MKRVLISAAVNSNDAYVFYLPFFIDSWINQRHDIYQFIPRVICINFTPELSAEHSKYCESLYFDSTVSDVTLAQLARYMVFPDDTFDFLVSTDIDMIPISTLPFAKALTFIKDKSKQFVVMRNVLPPGQFPICYNIASPSVWRQILNNYFQTSDFFQIVRKLELDSSAVSDWYLDQKLLYLLLISQDFADLILLDDVDTGLKRLDRSNHAFPINWFILFLGFMNRFTEYHSARASSETRIFLKILTHRNRRKI